MGCGFSEVVFAVDLCAGKEIECLNILIEIGISLRLYIVFGKPLLTYLLFGGFGSEWIVAFCCL